MNNVEVINDEFGYGTATNHFRQNKRNSLHIKDEVMDQLGA